MIFIINIMTKFLFCLLFITNFVYSQEIPIDKKEHFAVGFIVGGIYSAPKEIKHPFWSSVAVATTAGVAKEMYDSRTNGDVSSGDIYATVIGGVVSGGIVYLIKKKLNKRKKDKKLLKFKKSSIY